ncbi:hypothetical protein B0H13DRAFT_1922890 [Mycena leptocephala]|nr:hypothetical protein B0H13DRAFT_1922890 [Mycena leptocephala]
MIYLVQSSSTSSSRSTGFTGLPGRTPPRRRVTTCSMEEGQAAGNETHQMTDSSPIARIAALEQRIAALETVIKNMSHDSARQRPQTTDTLTTITPWRVLNSVIILGLCAYKALDWIIGVLWTLIICHLAKSGFTSHSVECLPNNSSTGAVPAICKLVFDRICHLAESGFDKSFCGQHWVLFLQYASWYSTEFAIWKDQALYKSFCGVSSQ